MAGKKFRDTRETETQKYYADKQRTECIKSEIGVEDNETANISFLFTISPRVAVANCVDKKFTVTFRDETFENFYTIRGKNFSCTFIGFN